jgi:DNA replication protein DnaC
VEIIDATVRQLERGEVTPIEAIDALLAEELAIRESRRVRTALVMARLSTIKTLAGFDFAFQPSLDRNRIMALAELGFGDRNEVVYFLGPPGTGNSHLAIALGVEAVRAGRSVYFATLADMVGALAKAGREGHLKERLRFFCRPQLLIVDGIGYLPVVPGGGNLFFQLVNARYEKGAMIPTSNRGFAASRAATAALVPCGSGSMALPSMGRGVRRSRGGDRLAGPAAPPRGRRPDRGFELPPAPARRARAGAHPLQGADCAAPGGARAAAARTSPLRTGASITPPADHRTPPPHLGKFASALLGNIQAALTHLNSVWNWTMRGTGPEPGDTHVRAANRRFFLPCLVLAWLSAKEGSPVPAWARSRRWLAEQPPTRRRAR